MPRLSRCLGCTGYVRHTAPPEDESILERAYCDVCLAGLKLPPRGTCQAWKESSAILEEEEEREERRAHAQFGVGA